ncbi:MAG: LuxR family transcriptional regulator [Paracoccaceae bacterium]
MLIHLEKVLEATSIEEVWTLHLAAMREYGFGNLIYGLTRFRGGTNFGPVNDMLILSNHDKEYLDRFVGGGLYQDAPLLKWAADNGGAISWRWIDELDRAGSLTRQEKSVIDFNMRHGLRAGYAISFKDISSSTKGAIGLSLGPDGRQHQADAIWEQHGREIIFINNVTHLKMASLPFVGNSRKLTARQREALEWAGNGKTSLDIAQIMGLTQGTVEKHLRLAREVLGVETTTQAVMKASVRNQIFLVPG